jgi:hypothetical protein
MNELPATPYLDFSAEVSASRLEEIISDERAWVLGGIDPTNAVFSLDAQT